MPEPVRAFPLLKTNLFQINGTRARTGEEEADEGLRPFDPQQARLRQSGGR